jgi:hypothetical protein
MDAGGTSPWMGEGRTMQERLSRATQDDSMDGIGRVESGTETEQLPSPL